LLPEFENARRGAMIEWWTREISEEAKEFRRWSNNGRDICQYTHTALALEIRRRIPFLCVYTIHWYYLQLISWVSLAFFHKTGT
jgi:hypothetical protein